MLFWISCWIPLDILFWIWFLNSFIGRCLQVHSLSIAFSRRSLFSVIVLCRWLKARLDAGARNRALWGIALCFWVKTKSYLHALVEGILRLMKDWINDRGVSCSSKYTHVPHSDVKANDGPHRQWQSHKITMELNIPIAEWCRSHPNVIAQHRAHEFVVVLCKQTCCQAYERLADTIMYRTWCLITTINNCVTGLCLYYTFHHYFRLYPCYL